MKQLKKMKLSDFQEMTDSEMKFVIGGNASGTSGASGASESCPSGTAHCYCDKYTHKEYKGCISASQCWNAC